MKGTCERRETRAELSHLSLFDASVFDPNSAHHWSRVRFRELSSSVRSEVVVRELIRSFFVARRDFTKLAAKLAYGPSSKPLKEGRVSVLLLLLPHSLDISNLSL